MFCCLLNYYPILKYTEKKPHIFDKILFSTISGPALAGISKYSNNPCVVSMGVFSTASFSLLKLRKDVELWEICTSLLQKVPKILTKVNIKIDIFH